MKKQFLMALLVGCAVVAAGCSSKTKETEAPKPVETAAARDTEAAVAETEAAAVAETEAAAVVETEAKAAETEAEAVETEAEAVETEAETVETEAETVETEAEVVETEAEAVETEAETVETEADVAETEAEAVETEAEVFEAGTESEFYDYYETETEYVPVTAPEYDISDYLEIKDEDYKDLTVQVAPATRATDEEVNAEIANAFEYLEDHDDLVEKITKGKVKMGDTVNIDYVGTKDGEAFDGGTAEGYDLEIGSGSFIDGFEDGLIGKEIGSEVDLNLTFPEDYGVEELNGADVVFHVTLNYISKMPELTDELAKKLSGDEYDNVKDYVESVRSDIQAGYDEEYRNGVYGKIMEKLVELYPLDEYPEENVQYYEDSIMAQYIEPYAQMYGMSIEDFIAAAYGGLTEEEFREQQLLPAAQANLSQEMILTAIGELEGITMTDQELDKLLEEYAEEYGVSVEELTQGTDRETIRNSELQHKVMEWLYENVTIEETEETEAAEVLGNETEAETQASGAETETETE